MSSDVCAERLWTDAPVLCTPQQRLALDVPEASRLVRVVDGQADGSNVLQSLWRENQSCPHSLSVDWARPSAELRGSAGEQGQTAARCGGLTRGTSPE